MTKRWYEIKYVDFRSPSEYALDHRRRNRTSAESLAANMWHSGLYKRVWLVEMTSTPDAPGYNEWTATAMPLPRQLKVKAARCA